MKITFNWAPLVAYIKSGDFWDFELLAGDPEAYGEKLADVVENCIQGNSLIEIFDGMISKPIIVGICIAVSKFLKKEE